MSFSEELCESLLARVEVDMNLGAPTTTNLFTVPTGFGALIEKVLMVPAATGFTTLGASADMDLGKVGALTDYSNAYDPKALVDGTTFLSIPSDTPTQPVIYDAGEIFAITNNDAAAAGSLVDFYVIGRLFVP